MQTTKNLIGIAESILAGPSIEEVPTPKNTIVDDGLKAVKVPDSYMDAILGFAGSLTTMSALSIESVDMLSGGNYSQALLNILLNLGLSLLAASLGVLLAKYGLNLAQS